LGPLFIRRESKSDALPDSFMLQQWKPDLIKYNGPLLGKSKDYWEIRDAKAALYVYADSSSRTMPAMLHAPWQTTSDGTEPAPHLVQCSGFVDYNPAIPHMPRTNYEIMASQPVTMAVLLLILAYGYYLWNYRVDVDAVSCSYRRIVVEHQYYRIFTSSFAHVDLMHIGFNLMTLYQFGTVEAFVEGSFRYAYSSLNLVVWTILLLVAMQYAHAKYVNDDSILTHSGIGYSCVLFAWMVVASVKMDQFCPVFFLPTWCFTTIFIANSPYFPVNFGPLVLLVATKFVMPRSSFVGHLSGLLLGFPLAWGYFDEFTTPVLLAGSALCVVWLEQLYAYPAAGGDGAAGTGASVLAALVSGGADALAALWGVSGDGCGLSAVASPRVQLAQLLAVVAKVNHCPSAAPAADLERCRSFVNSMNRNRLALLRMYSNCCRALKILLLCALGVTVVLAGLVGVGVLRALIRVGVLLLLLACFYLCELYAQRYYQLRLQPQVERSLHLLSPGDGDDICNVPVSSSYDADTHNAVLLEARERQFCRLLLVTLFSCLGMFAYDCSNVGALLSSYQLLVSNAAHRLPGGGAGAVLLSYPARVSAGTACHALLALLELLAVGMTGVCLKAVRGNDSQDAEYNPNAIEARGALLWLRLLNDPLLVHLEAAVKQLPATAAPCCCCLGACGSCAGWSGGSVQVAADARGSYALVGGGVGPAGGVALVEVAGEQDDLEMSRSRATHTSYHEETAGPAASSVVDAPAPARSMASSEVAPVTEARVSAAAAARNAALKRYENNPQR
jgi:membrane associated rhomboid family serine protease